MYAPPLSTDAGALNSRPVNPPEPRTSRPYPHSAAGGYDSANVHSRQSPLPPR